MNSQTFKEPDFAYPKTVEKQAQALLASADHKSGTKAAVTRLRGTLELCAAQAAIDRNAAFAQPAFIAGQADRLKDAPRALMLALEASVLTGIYTSDKWKYDRVDAPVEPVPADVALWSGAQFRAQVDSLLRQAATIALEAPAMPMKTFEACISQDALTRQYFPTVADFVLWQGYSLSIRCGNDDAEARFRTEALMHNAAGTDPWFYWTATGASTEDLWKTYCAYSDTEGARYLLDRIGGAYYRIGNEMADELAEALETSLKRFPKWYNNSALRNNLRSLTAPRIDYSYPPMVAPGHDVEVKVKYDYARTIEATLYQIPEGSDLNASQVMQRKSCASDTFSAVGRRGNATLRLRVPAAGTYAVIIKVDGKVADYYSRNKILATPLMGFAVSGATDAAAVAVDFTTGMPLGGVDVKELIPGRTKKLGKQIGRTDNDGICLWNIAGTDANVGFSYQGIDYAFNGNLYVSGPREEKPEEETIVNILTDRSLYHAGETISWAVVAACRSGAPDAVPSALKGEKLYVSLYDANDQLVETDTVTTDAYGRADGTFVAAGDRLTGYYSLRASGNRGIRGYSHVMVSDFKLPTFEAAITGIERDVPQPGCVRVSGNARTYTGMPVAGADVSIAITGAIRWRWFAPATKLGTFNTTTDAAGLFSFDIPVDSLNTADDNRKFNNFIVDVTVTSATAETASASRPFTTGKPYILQLKKEDIIADASKPVDILINAFEADGDAVGINVRWQLGRNNPDGVFGGIVAEGSAVTGKPAQMMLGDVDAGAYTMRLLPEDTALADTVVQGSIVLYNIAKNRVPSLDSPIFLPESDFVSTGSSVKVPVGIAAPRACMYVAVSSGTRLLQIAPQVLSYGFHEVEIPTPALDDNLLNVRLIVVLDGKVKYTTVNIKAPAKPVAKLEAESFRDRLVPGTRETWRFRLCRDGKTLADAAMIATMYNKAIESLQTYNSTGLHFAFSRFTPTLRVCFDYSWLISGNYTSTFSYDKVVRWPEPEFLFRNIGIMNELLMFNEAYIGAAEVTEGVSDLASGSTMMKSAMRIRGTAAMSKASADMDDVAVETEEEAPAEAGAAAGGADEKFDYRVAEQLQIFWKPALVADGKGNIDLVFDMPDAIGSWMFRAMAWTPALETASYMAECMSNKPVMVQPSLPRFLRQGDKAVLPATVYNNSGDEVVVETVVELFDLATGKTVSSVKSSDKIAPGASAIVKIDIDVAADAQSAGYRVRSRSGSFSDGEQTAIPVLASSANVVESTEFYLNPGDKSFSLSISAKEAADAVLTLQYCQNPVWTVVKAMRGLMDGGKTSTGNVGALFSALAGRHITATNPAIAEALKEWKANPSEEALVSMLARNENLKQLVLNQTPWVSATNSQTARMQALSELLDPAATTAAINKCVDALVKLQQPDGGFAWGGWSNSSSVWCTETVLTTMGLANSLGMLPADNATLAGMLDKGYAYLQKEATRPNAPETDEALALIAALYPGKSLTPGAREVVRATVADIAKNWRNHGTVGKAYDILILSANARRSLCGEIFESIRQFGDEQPGRGLCFPNVDDIRGYATIIQAYKTMNASDAEIDAMRQWILVRAQATDDLGAYNPDYVIAAVLLTGSNWTSVAVDPAVKVNGKQLAVTAVECNTGYFSQTLTGQGRKGIKLEIGTNGVTPSYGSVVAIRRMPMSEIAARPGADISIEKRVLVNRGGQWVETNDFALGERVRVQLAIQTKRDLEYLTINDERPAAFQPVDQMPGFVWAAGTAFYRENLDAATNLFIGYLSAGTYYLTYDMTAATAGTFISGIATAQSQYAPEITAHSGAAAITVK